MSLLKKLGLVEENPNYYDNSDMDFQNVSYDESDVDANSGGF